MPVYNEVENIPCVFAETTRVLDKLGYVYELLWVEDGSDDGTSALVDEQARTYSFVRAIHLKRNWGQSAALAAGFEQAKGDIIIPMDADRQNDPADIPALLEEFNAGYDCVSGRRVERKDPWHKTIPSAIQTRLAKLTGPDINDFGCTLKVYDDDALGDVDLYGEGHRYLPAKLYDKGYSVTEVDVNHRPREHGESRYGVGRLIRGFADLVFHWFWNGYSSRPFHLFGGGGFVLAGIGGTIGAGVVIYNWLAPGVTLGPYLPHLLLAVGLVLFGSLGIMFGTILEFLTKLYYRQDTEYRIDRIVEGPEQ